MAGDEDAGAGGQGGADVAAGSGESVGDVLHGGGDQDGVVSDGDGWGGGDGVELAHEVLAVGGEDRAVVDALRGQQRVGVGVGGSGGSCVGVDPGTGGGDVAGGEAAADGDAGLGEGVADAVEDHCGVVVELGAADGQEQGAVVFGGVEVAGAGEAGSLAGADGDVAADGDFDDGGAVGLGAQQVDHDAVGGGEAQQGGDRKSVV